MTVLNLQVAASVDDSRTVIGQFSFSNTVASSEWGNAGGTVYEGWFAWDVAIAQGTTLTSAEMSGYVIGGGTNYPTMKLLAKANDIDNHVPPTDGTSSNNKTLTTGTAWELSSNPGTNVWITKDITTEIQTVINRAGFVSGNKIGVRIIDNGSTTNASPLIQHYDGDSTKAAKLDITYGAGGTTYNESGSGGLSFAGTATPKGTYNLVGVPGPLTFAGAATSKGAYNTSSGGGLVLAGSGTEKGTYNLAGSGGIILAGAATEQETANVSGDGGAVFSGTATEQGTYNLAGSGTLTIGGSVEPQQTGSETGSGGVVFAGVADIQANYNLEGSGGLAMTGLATEQSVYNVVSNEDGNGEIAICKAVGGVLAGVHVNYNLVGDGGLVLSGASVVLATYSIGGDGGLVLSGEAGVETSRTFNEEGSGLLFIDGSATPQITFSETGLGLVVFSGNAEWEDGAAIYVSVTGPLGVTGQSILGTVEQSVLFASLQSITGVSGLGVLFANSQTITGIDHE